MVSVPHGVKTNDLSVFISWEKKFKVQIGYISVSFTSSRQGLDLKTLKESLAFELTVLPLSLFNNEQMLRKANKRRE